MLSGEWRTLQYEPEQCRTTKNHKEIIGYIQVKFILQHPNRTNTQPAVHNDLQKA